jgi:restriction system protein
MIIAADGGYEFDITCRFSGLGADFLVLVECKRHKNRIKREHVQALFSKMQSVGAQKAIMCTTSGFQAGAVVFARSHGIALVQVADGRTSWATRDASPETKPWSRVPNEIERVVGWLIGETPNHFSLVTARHSDYLRKALGFNSNRNGS